MPKIFLSHFAALIPYCFVLPGFANLACFYLDEIFMASKWCYFYSSCTVTSLIKMINFSIFGEARLFFQIYFFECLHILILELQYYYCFCSFLCTLMDLLILFSIFMMSEKFIRSFNSKIFSVFI